MGGKFCVVSGDMSQVEAAPSLQLGTFPESQTLNAHSSKHADIQKLDSTTLANRTGSDQVFVELVRLIVTGWDCSRFNFHIGLLNIRTSKTDAKIF